MPPKKSIFRGPDAQHFQLVHRSLRDPLTNDPEASQRILRPVERGNDRRNGTTLADLDATIDKTQLRPNEGEAALYGITYDDSSYDYMSHLKSITPGGIPTSNSPNDDVYLIPGPRGSAAPKGLNSRAKDKGKNKATDLFNFLPSDVFASDERDMKSVQSVWEGGEGVPSELRGLQPDMDPHLRQVLEALEDDEFVDDEEGEEEGEGWFGELVGGGEVGQGEREEFVFEEWGVEGDEGVKGKGNGYGKVGGDGEVESWEDRFKVFKETGKALDVGSVVGDEDEDLERSELADTLGSMVSGLGDLTVKGGKKRRGKRGPSDASGMSMSSSSMFRNAGLRDLDDRFDKVERDYDIEEEDEDDFPDDDDVSIAPSMSSNISRLSAFSTRSTQSHDVPPELSREDFESIMDDFLENYEVVGRKYRPALGGVGLTGAEKLAVLRSAVEEGEDGLGKEENRRRILEIERVNRGTGGLEEREKVKREEGEGDKWDVETILTTYTNTENHPATIRSRVIPKDGQNGTVPAPKSRRQVVEESESSGSETEMDEPKVTVTRKKGETAEERKARKAGVKEDRAARRTEKKSHKATFSEERKKQLISHRKMVGGGRASDLSVGASRGVVSLS